jgi:hypothetical protein
MGYNFNFCQTYDKEDITPEDFPLRGLCTVNLNNLDKGENKVYIKCRDTNGNTNTQDDLTYTLFSSQSELKISSVSPQGEVKGAGKQFSVNLTATTSGGAEKGKAVCRFNFENSPVTGTDFFTQTSLTNHKYTFRNLKDGDYNIKITCNDLAGNTAEGSAVFNLKIDSSPPVITRIFRDGNRINLVTNEEARCYYNTNPADKCGFNTESGTAITTAFSKKHAIELNDISTYYIKCTDVFGIENPDCARIISPGF